MFDRLTNFGYIRLEGTSETAATASGEYEVDMVALAQEDTLHDLRVVAVPSADVAGTMTLTLKHGDASTSLSALQSFTFDEIKKGVALKMPFPLEHKRYLGIEASGKVTVDLFCGLEFGA